MEQSARISLPAYAHLVRTNANFRRLWMAQIVSEIGDWLYTVAIYNQLLHITGGSARSIGFAFVLQVLPQMLVSPMAGVLNDRLSRRRLMIVSDWARAVIVTAMLFAQAAGILWLIYVLLFLETVFWALFEPARNAVIPNISTEEEVLVANALSATTWSFNFAVGFSLGGVIAARAGSTTVFVINALSFVLSSILIWRMRFNEPHMEHLPPVRVRELGDFSPVVDGLRYVRRDVRLLATLCVKCGLGFIGANWVLVTILGERVFPVQLPGFDPSAAGMLGMSALMGSRGLGALIGPFVGNLIAGRSQPGMRRGILIGFVATGIGYVLLGIVPNALLACLCLMLAHGGASIIWVFSTTLLQLNSDDKYRGRLFSAEFALMTLSMSATSSLAGWLVDLRLPPQQVAGWLGALMFVPAVAWLYALRLWRRPV